MAADTSIEWADHTFNPWIGCTKVSPGCDHCYAARSAPTRVLRARRIETWGTDGQRFRTNVWGDPPRWNRRHAEFFARHGRRQRVFCASLADWLDNEAPIEYLVELLDLIRLTPDLDWLLLTKRIGNFDKRLRSAREAVDFDRQRDLWLWITDWYRDCVPPANVWIGATVVDQTEADRDIPKLLAVPARVRFLSVEPMLGPINLERIEIGDHRHPLGTWCAPLTGCFTDSPRLNWVICGGESGPGARPMHPDWARSLRDQCEAAGVPFLFKQWGEWVPADDTCDGVFPVTQIVGDVDWKEGKRVRVQWLSPNDSIVGHSFARIGRKAAGRQIDGREHDDFPRSVL